MAKRYVISWDETNFVSKLLDPNDHALINNIDVTGSDTLSLGLSASYVTIANPSSLFVVSGSSLMLAEVTASAGLKVTGSVNLPGQTSFGLDGQFLTTENFTAINLSRLFDGSNVDDLHTHSVATLASGTVIKNPDLVQTIPAGVGLTGTQVVYMAGNSAELADSDTVSTSRVIGIVSGSTSVFYNSGTLVDVHTVHGDVFGGFTGLVPGAVYYLGSLGTITTTPSFVAGKSVMQVGIAKTTDELIFNPEFITRGLV